MCGEHGGNEGPFCIQEASKVEVAKRRSQGTSGWRRTEVLPLLEQPVQAERHLDQMLCNLDAPVKQLNVSVTGTGRRAGDGPLSVRLGRGTAGSTLGWPGDGMPS